MCGIIKKEAGDKMKGIAINEKCPKVFVWFFGVKTNPKEGFRGVLPRHMSTGGHQPLKALTSKSKEAKGSDQNELGSKYHFI